MQSPQKSAPVPAQRGRKPGRGKPPGQSAVPKKGRSPKNIPLTKSTSHTENLKTRKKSLKPGKKVSPYLLYFILQNFVVRFFKLLFLNFLSSLQPSGLYCFQQSITRKGFRIAFLEYFGIRSCGLFYSQTRLLFYLWVINCVEKC